MTSGGIKEIRYSQPFIATSFLYFVKLYGQKNYNCINIKNHTYLLYVHCTHKFVYLIFNLLYTFYHTFWPFSGIIHNYKWLLRMYKLKYTKPQ